MVLQVEQIVACYTSSVETKQSGSTTEVEGHISVTFGYFSFSFAFLGRVHTEYVTPGVLFTFQSCWKLLGLQGFSFGLSAGLTPERNAQTLGRDVGSFKFPVCQVGVV